MQLLLILKITWSKTINNNCVQVFMIHFHSSILKIPCIFISIKNIIWRNISFVELINSSCSTHVWIFVNYLFFFFLQRSVTLALSQGISPFFFLSFNFGIIFSLFSSSYFFKLLFTQNWIFLLFSCPLSSFFLTWYSPVSHLSYPPFPLPFHLAFLSFSLPPRNLCSIYNIWYIQLFSQWISF